jgi:hypothetical protein
MASRVWRRITKAITLYIAELALKIILYLLVSKFNILINNTDRYCGLGQWGVDWKETFLLLLHQLVVPLRLQ